MYDFCSEIKLFVYEWYMNRFIERGWLFRRTSIDIQSFQSFAYSIETPAIMLSKSSHTPKLGSWVSESQSYSST